MVKFVWEESAPALFSGINKACWTWEQELTNQLLKMVSYISGSNLCTSFISFCYCNVAFLFHKWL